MTDQTWWQDDDNKMTVVLPSVAAIAVYTSADGNIVIRQQDIYGDEDEVLIIPRAHANKLANAIRAEAKKPFDPL